MAYISLEDVQAWTDGSKLFLTALDENLADQQTAEVLNRISAVYDTSGWTDEASTPTLVQKIIAMLYVGWYYQRTYSEDEDTSSYGLLLIARAEQLLEGIESGSLIIDGEVLSTVNIALSPNSGDVYPNDASSAACPTYEDPSLGGPAFTMGTIW